MAVITVAATDAGEVENWAIPPQSVSLESSIPRGVLRFDNSAAIAAKLAADETRINITLSFTQAYCYLLKQAVVQIRSDDQVMDFDSVGQINYDLGALVDTQAEMVSNGVLHTAAALSAKRIYQPSPGYVRPFMDGELDDIKLQFADISTDASSAGDVFWFLEFWIFDKQQCDYWAVNSYNPVYSMG